MTFDPVGRARAAWGGLARQWRKLAHWLGPGIDSVRGTVNFNELVKVVIFAMTNGGLSVFLQALASASSLVFIDPATASAVSNLIIAATAVVDYLRRRGHGSPPSFMPAAAPPRESEASPWPTDRSRDTRPEKHTR